MGRRSGISACTVMYDHGTVRDVHGRYVTLGGDDHDHADPPSDPTRCCSLLVVLAPAGEPVRRPPPTRRTWSPATGSPSRAGAGSRPGPSRSTSRPRRSPPAAVNGPHRVRITLPNDYFQSGSTRYPVLYLLHGGAGGNSRAVDDRRRRRRAASPTAGRSSRSCPTAARSAGTRTGSTSRGGAQNWARLPHRPADPVDRRQPAHDRLEERPRHRRPLDGRLRRGPLRAGPSRPVRLRRELLRRGRPRRLRHPRGGHRAGRPERLQPATARSATRSGRSTAPGTRSTRSTAPRACRAWAWRSTPAAGINDQDVLEGTMRASADRFHDALNAAGVPHFYWMYGRPGPSAPYGCDGGHNFGCWNFALNDAHAADPGRARRTPPPPPPPATRVADGGFEDAGPRAVGLPGQLRRRPRRRAGPHRHRQRLGPQHLRLERPPPDDRRRRRTAPTRSPRGSGPRRTTPTATSGCAPRAARCVGEQQFARLDGYTKVTVDGEQRLEHVASSSTPACGPTATPGRRSTT